MPFLTARDQAGVARCSDFFGRAAVSSVSMPLTQDNLASAIEKLSTYAVAQFNAAYAIVTAAQVPNPTDDQKKARAAELAKAQAQMTSALQQLVQADTMFSEQRGREGYAALVTLLENTKDLAALAYDRIKAVMQDTSGGTSQDQTARNEQLVSLASVLQALARIDPVPVWQKAPSSGGAAG